MYFYKNDLIKINNLDFTDIVLNDKSRSMRGTQKVTENAFHSILRLFDVLPNFPFITSETMRDYH